MEKANTQERIKAVLASAEKVLLEKNRRYGDSALSPMQVFSKIPAKQAILVRLDDKLSRVKNSSELRKNDVFDILGYLILLSVQECWTFEDLID